MGNSSFAQEFNDMGAYVHRIAQEKGWWEEDRNDGEIVALIHSEASELLEGLRKGNPPAEHIAQPCGWPEDMEFCQAEEELADIVIRCMDFAAARGWDLGEAIRAKVDFNRTREHKHGGKLF